MNYVNQITPEGYYQLPPPGYPHTPLQEEKEIHLRDYWKVILKRRWMIVACFLIVVITTGIATFTMRPVYRSTTTIQINKENPQIVDFKEIFAVNTMDLDYYQTQYKVLESRSLAKRVIQSLKLSEQEEFLPQPETAYQRWKSEILTSISDLLNSSKRSSPKKPSENERRRPLRSISFSAS